MRPIKRGVRGKAGGAHLLKVDGRGIWAEWDKLHIVNARHLHAMSDEAGDVSGDWRCSAEEMAGARSRQRTTSRLKTPMDVAAEMTIR